MNLWRYYDLDQYQWADDCPGPGWAVAPTMYEDELPVMSWEEYDNWFKNSEVVYGVRMGPLVE